MNSARTSFFSPCLCPFQANTKMSWSPLALPLPLLPPGGHKLAHHEFVCLGQHGQRLKVLALPLDCVTLGEAPGFSEHSGLICRMQGSGPPGPPPPPPASVLPCLICSSPHLPCICSAPRDWGYAQACSGAHPPASSTPLPRGADINPAPAPHLSLGFLGQEAQVVVPISWHCGQL